MKQDYQRLLKPDIIHSVSGLELIAKVIVEGHLPGLHNSRRVGAGLEFSQYRGYEPGDDMRLLDWKMLARSGRYYMKQSEIETHIAVKFILDTSRSMLHEENGLTKMDHAKVLVAALAHLSKNQGDAIGLYALNDRKLHTLHPTVQKQQYQRLLHELVQVSPEGIWPEGTTAIDRMHDRNHKELLLFITDLYEQGTELTHFVKSLKTGRNEVVVLHLMGHDELQFAYKGPVVFEDLETGKRVRANTKEVRALYLAKLDSLLSTTKDTLLSHGIGYEMFDLREPIGNALQTFLKKRKNLM